MPDVAGNIVKSEDIEIQGKVNLDLFGSNPLASASNDQSAPPASPAVRIVEKNQKYAIMEVTCPCGSKTMIKCDFAV